MTQDVEDCNEVRLVGRVSTAPEAKELPSGDVVWLFRLVVRRPEGHVSRQSVDVLDCSVWAPRQPLTERCSRVEVEVRRGRVRRRAAAA